MPSSSLDLRIAAAQRRWMLVSFVRALPWCVTIALVATAVAITAGKYTASWPAWSTLLGVAIGTGLLDPVAFVRRVPTGVFVAAALAVVTFWVGLDLSSPTQFWALNAFGGWTVLGLAQACGLLWLLGRRSRLGDALCHPVLQFFGDISYSAYLWHWPVMLVLTDDRLGNPPVGLRMAIQATTFVALVTATRVVVELPLLARKRRFGRVTSPLR